MTIPNDTINVCQSVTNFGRGLTKREYFAAMAMQGCLSNIDNAPITDFKSAAKYCVNMADALINALNEPNKP